MNTLTNGTKNPILDNLKIRFKDIDIIEYSKKDHKEGKYPDDFIYICDKNTDKIYLLNNLELAYFNEITQYFLYDNFDIFCYSKNNTQTMYNSYKPVGDSFQLIIKAKIDNLLDL